MNSGTRNPNQFCPTSEARLDDEAFSRIYGFKSHPFAVKPGQKIAVRVISQFGEETTKVMEVKG